MLRRIGSIAVCILLVVLFAPIQLGGATTYAIIDGNSMEPMLKEGDLVVLRSSTSLSVDDIALYSHPEIGPIIHRIISTEENRFVFKGDNNDWTDSHEATQEEILGKYWFSLPKVGIVLSWLHTAVGISVASALAAGLVIGSKPSTQGAKKEKGQKGKKSALDSRSLGLTPLSVRDAFWISLGAFILLIPVGLLAFLSPTYVSAQIEYPYQHVGEFSYSSDVPAMGIYDQGFLKPGDPIFRRISNSFNLSFSYRFLADGLADSRGTYSLSATVGEANGWSRTVDLIPPTAFEGASLELSSKISIDDLQSIVDNLQNVTGFELSQYNLTIQPKVQMLGLMNGVVWQSEYSPSLPFIVNDIEVRLNANTGEENSILSQVEAGAVTGPTQALNKLGLLGINIDIQTLRTFLLVVLPVLAVSSLLTGIKWQKLAQAGEPSRISGIFGPRLVDVSGMLQANPMKQISVYQIEDLVRIADLEGSSIFHEKSMEAHFYFVEGRNGIYVYRLER